MKDYYKILDIPRTADEAAIKKAHRALALQYHPDRNTSPDAAAKFIEVQEAYDTLGDAEKKARYDQYYSYHDYAEQDNTTSRGGEENTQQQEYYQYYQPDENAGYGKLGWFIIPAAAIFVIVVIIYGLFFATSPDDNLHEDTRVYFVVPDSLTGKYPDSVMVKKVIAIPEDSLVQLRSEKEALNYLDTAKKAK